MGGEVIERPYRVECTGRVTNVFSHTSAHPAFSRCTALQLTSTTYVCWILGPHITLGPSVFARSRAYVTHTHVLILNEPSGQICAQEPNARLRLHQLAVHFLLCPGSLQPTAQRARPSMTSCGTMRPAINGRCGFMQRPCASDPVTEFVKQIRARLKSRGASEPRHAEGVEVRVCLGTGPCHGFAPRMNT